ncbi:hypothetical protein OCAR_6049 [Afipia carboxidovorans OM5]|nr:hypothetical protein OCAR_6049 [Afipia carboxidovorans OM5]
MGTVIKNDLYTTHFIYNRIQESGIFLRPNPDLVGRIE